MQEEIAALRGVLSGMAVRVEHHAPFISETLPRYEEANNGECRIDQTNLSAGILM